MRHVARQQADEPQAVYNLAGAQMCSEARGADGRALDRHLVGV